MDTQTRLRTKNEATGVRVVGQFVQEFWECGWQPFDSRNDQGIDGIILMRKKGQDLGVKINVQVKCGAKYISSFDENEIRISIDDDKGLQRHIEYWKKQNDPTVLIFVNPCKLKRDKNGNILKDDKGKMIWVDQRLNAKAWWVDLRGDDIQPDNTKTLIRIDIKNNFGQHSKGSFLKLIRPYLSISHLPRIQLNQESKNLMFSDSLKKDSRDFFKSWKASSKVPCKAINQNITVSRTGWRHILLSRRGKERRVNSLKLLGAAKQIIEEVEKFYLLTQSEDATRLEQKYGLRV